MLRITPTLAIPESALDISFIRASGPGGQNVNKLSTAVQLRFQIDGEGALPPAMRARLAALAGRRLTSNGCLVITARRYRTQEDNRRDAVTRLVSLLRQASEAPKLRRATKPTKGSIERRKTDKAHIARRKAARRRVPDA